MKRIGFQFANGIGDVILGSTFVDLIRAADPSREYHLIVGKNRWTEFLTAKLKGRCHHGKPKDIETFVRVLPHHIGKLSVMQGYFDFARCEIPQLPKIETPSRPYYHGASSFTLVPEYVGLAWSLRQHGKHWQKMPLLCDELNSRGVDARLVPMFRLPKNTVRWISHCKLFVGTDTGLVHLAAAMGVPVVYIHGGRFTDRTFPWDIASHVQNKHCTRSPCFCWWPMCRVKGYRMKCHIEVPCLEKTQIDDVLSVVLTALRTSALEPTI